MGVISVVFSERDGIRVSKTDPWKQKQAQAQLPTSVIAFKSCNIEAVPIAQSLEPSSDANRTCRMSNSFSKVRK